jgi:hypothetical protein
MRPLKTSLPYTTGKLVIGFLLLFGWLLSWFISPVAIAAKGSAPIYEDPFDIGGGGASLTRATQAGMIFSNPALIPYGPGFHRWAGNDATLIVGKNSVDFVKSIKNGGSGSGNTAVVKMIDTVMKNPLHAGVINSFAYINRVFGLSTFNRGEVDISAKKYGDTGLPALRFRAESYQGVALSAASIPFSKAISLGVTGKYIYASEPDLALDLTDQEGIKKLQSSSGLQSLTSMNTGMGYDAGMLIFLQGYNSDYRLAVKIDDVGGTKLSGKGDLKTLKQVYCLGLGYTIHNGIDAIHFSADYRDIQQSYKEELFKRVRMGTKIVFRKHLGLAMGYYDGWPSYGLELDAWVLRLTAAYYTREFGAKPGIDPRPIYALGFSMGM